MDRIPWRSVATKKWMKADDTPTTHGVSRDCKDIFEGVICLACGGVHLVNTKTGNVLGAAEEQASSRPIAVR